MAKKDDDVGRKVKGQNAPSARHTGDVSVCEDTRPPRSREGTHPARISRMRDTVTPIGSANKVKDLPPSRQKIAKQQNGICPVCKSTLFNDEELHVHHKKPKAKGGKDNYGNLELVHAFCHQQIHAREGVDDGLMGKGSS